MIIAIDGTAAAGKSTLARRIAQALRSAASRYGLRFTGQLRATCFKPGRALTTRKRRRRPRRSSIRRRFPTRRFASKAMARPPPWSRPFPKCGRRFCFFSAHLPLSRAGRLSKGAISARLSARCQCEDFRDREPESRARRRHKELVGYGVEISEETVLQEIIDRDRRDSERAISPLKPAKDALLLDTTELDIEKAFAVALELIDKVASRR